MSFTLLNSSKDWTSYYTATLREHGAAPDMVRISAGPIEYPCLVESLLQRDQRGMCLLNCFVYKADAKLLFTKNTDQVEAKADAEPVNPTELAALHKAADRREYDSSVLAHLLTIVYFLIETSICDEARYETEYAAKLALVEQVNAERLASILKELPGWREKREPDNA